MISIILDEEQYAKEVEDGIHQYLSHNALVKYLTMLYKKDFLQENKYDVGGICNKIFKILINKYNYTNGKIVESHSDTLSIIRKFCSERYYLQKVDGVKVTKKELNKIKELNNRHLELLTFGMLVIKKYENLKYRTNNEYLKMESKDFYCKTTSETRNRKKQASSFRNLAKNGYIEIPSLSDFGRNTRIKLTYIDLDDSNYEILITDFREVGLIYLKYIGENIIECEECGRLIQATNNKVKYCQSCAKIIKNEQNKSYISKLGK